MIRFERTHDMELVRRVMTHPRVYPYLIDDGCPPAEEFVPPDVPAFWYVTVWDDAELLGLWMLHPQTTISWEIHTCLLPCAWGPRAREAARLLAPWLWSHTPCRRVTTHVPVSNRLALRFARNAGLREFGVDAQSILRGGRLEDQILLGISEGEETLCQPLSRSLQPR